MTVYFYTPSVISTLNENQVFVFGSNKSGFHGAGAAGLACRGDSGNNWRRDEWFLRAKRSPVGSEDRIGKWAVYGVARGYQKGNEGASYAIVTVAHPGKRRSVPLDDIYNQLIELIHYAYEHEHLEFLVTKIGCSLAGYAEADMRDLFLKLESNLKIPGNVVLPKEFECRQSI